MGSIHGKASISSSEQTHVNGDAGDGKIESIGRSHSTSFSTKTDSTAFEMIKNIAKTAIKNFQHNYATSRSFIVGTVGRFSPSLEDKILSPNERTALSPMQNDLKEMKQIQKKIHDLKSQHRALRKGYDAKLKAIDVADDTYTERKKIKEHKNSIISLECHLHGSYCVIGFVESYHPDVLKRLMADKKWGSRSKDERNDIESSCLAIEDHHRSIEKEKAAIEKIVTPQKEEALKDFEADEKKIAGEILSLRREWSVKKAEITSTQKKLPKGTFEHSLVARKMASTEQKMRVVFKKFELIESYDNKSCIEGQKTINEKLQALRDTSGTEPSAGLLKDIETELATLDERAILARVIGNTTLANEIEAYTAAVRKDPLLAAHSEKEITA